jgi:phage terminase large subunit-like protein
VAEAKMALFTSLRLMDVTGQPTIGEASDPWLLNFVATIFGAYDADLGEQLIKECLFLIAKKNTKSTMAAGILVTELALGWRHEDENLILAPTKEVADNSFKPAAAMIRADEDLNALLHIQDHIRLITQRSTKSTMKVVAATAGRWRARRPAGCWSTNSGCSAKWRRPRRCSKRRPAARRRSLKAIRST